MKPCTVALSCREERSIGSYCSTDPSVCAGFLCTARWCRGKDAACGNSAFLLCFVLLKTKQFIGTINVSIVLYNQGDMNG